MPISIPRYAPLSDLVVTYVLGLLSTTPAPLPFPWAMTFAVVAFVNGSEHHEEDRTYLIYISINRTGKIIQQ